MSDVMIYLHFHYLFVYNLSDVMIYLHFHYLFAMSDMPDSHNIRATYDKKESLKIFIYITQTFVCVTGEQCYKNCNKY